MIPTIKELEEKIEKLKQNRLKSKDELIAVTQLKVLREVEKIIDDEDDEDEESIIKFKKIIKQKLKEK